MKVLAPSPDYRLDRDPRRAPDWRYQRVRELLARPSVQRRLHREEKYVAEAARFIGRYQEAAGGSDEEKRAYRQRRIYPTNPELWSAWELFLGIVPGAAVDDTREVSVLDDPDRFGLRTVIEARVLAGMSPRQIGERSCLWEGTVIWYERLFYDVRTRLKYGDWVRMHLIGVIFGLGPSEMTFEKALKHFAYEAGPHVLEELLSDYDAAVTPPPAGTSRANYWGQQLLASAIRRCAAAIGDANFNNRELMQLLQLVCSLKSDQAADAHDETRASYETCMSGFLKNFKILTGPDGLREMQESLPIKGGGTFEPRIADLFRAKGDPQFAAELEAKLHRPLNRQKNQG